mgnify:CR=1 FL=1
MKPTGDRPKLPSAIAPSKSNLMQMSDRPEPYRNP